MPEINIYNEDCLPAMLKMKDNQFDLAIVDPPYGLGDMSHGWGTKVKHKRVKWNNEIPGPEYFKELYRISKHQIIWGCNYFGSNIIHKGRIVHYKDPTNGPMNKILSPCDLASQSFNNRIDYFRYRWSGNVQGSKINWNNSGPDARIHPTQKPISLYKWLLTNYAKQGDKILDTHLGSGSIAIACYDLGFDLDAYEIDKDYYDAAIKRFNTHKAQLKLFNA